MNSDLLAKAIRYLKPTAEFSFQEADYSTVKWDVLDGEAPTLSEIQAAAELVEKLQAEAIKTAAAKRAAAIAKLESLGLDEDDLKALGF